LRTAVAIERGDTDQRGDLPPVKPPQLWQLGHVHADSNYEQSNHLLAAIASL
jgi:hypothetical protein